jgi:hypothetical protein
MLRGFISSKNPGHSDQGALCYYIGLVLSVLNWSRAY